MKDNHKYIINIIYRFVQINLLMLVNNQKKKEKTTKNYLQ